MNHRWSRMQQRRAVMVVGLFVLLLITACASNQPKPLPQPTPDQVRSHADRAFEKLKQEEQENAAQPPVPRE
jgi:outer membrane biogenesis lipoprotein LolB